MSHRGALSRELEITTGRSDKKLKLDAGTLAIKETRAVPDEAISTRFHLSQCLKRCGLAYEFANLISFRAHELYTEKLLKYLSVEPPMGFQAATLAQILRADREVFSFMAQEVQDIRPERLYRCFPFGSFAQVYHERGHRSADQKAWK